ncbi:MAG TPA: type II toxin-antitoxin system RelE/ParE family toxin [Candidatus Binatia bacterium]
MDRRVIVLDEAEDELIEAQRWYEARRTGLGQDFRSAIDDAIARLLKAPLSASPVISLQASIEARRVLVKRFPYPSFSLTTTTIFGS